MTKKNTKRPGIPLETLLLDPAFRRHYEMLMREPEGATNPAVKAAIEDMLFEQAQANARSAERHARASSKGGQSASKQAAKKLEGRNNEIVRQAKLMLAKGKPRRGLAARLRRRFPEIGERQINNVLKEAGL